ncbi:DUF3800 domain-containing protein [Streptosporangium algeriense]|uniref:DUF3800 domain-containing protein n=1 Tax=Streptosporangium algeriense TaxID=1682748 RepID=A0ABW3DJN3_9ACTN
MSTRQLIRAYIDETGDRGTSATSSPYFAFAAVLVADEDEPQLRAVMSQLRRDLKTPPGKALHWKEHVKVYARRQHVAKTLGRLSGIQVIYVIVEKAAIPAQAGMRQDQVVFYNFAAGITMERILLATKDWPGRSRDVVVKFGHVRGFDHRTTCDYFEIKRATAPGWVPWHRLRGVVRFEDQAKWDGLQAADQYAGMLNTAIRTDQFGGYEASHLLEIRHQLRRDARGNSWKYGFKLLGNEATITGMPWWPQGGL